MTMELNATLLIQAGNFFILYLILRFLFFKPVVSAILHENRVELDTREEIIQLGNQLQETKNDQERLWGLTRRFFQEHKPALAQDFIFQGITPPLKEHVLTDTERSSLIQKTSELVVKKLEERP